MYVYFSSVFCCLSGANISYRVVYSKYEWKIFPGKVSQLLIKLHKFSTMSELPIMLAIILRICVHGYSSTYSN